MDIVLHLGAHRTGSTSFQRYMREVAEPLGTQKLAWWGPLRTRNGLFHGVADGKAPVGRPARSAGRVLMNARGVARRGYSSLVVSDENMMGTPRDNIKRGGMYPAAGVRMARFHAAFGGQVTRVVLQIRSPELYWASLYAFALERGIAFPRADQIAALAWAQRGWRDVITDLACALPGAEICVLPHERFAGRARQLLSVAVPTCSPPEPMKSHWANRSPDLCRLRRVLSDRGESPALLPDGEGRWMPFLPEDAARLRENYADDLHWLAAGADGLAKLIEDTDTGQTRTTWPLDPPTRGHSRNDRQTRPVAYTR